MSSRRGRGGGSRNPKDLPRPQQVSRKVSWLLRHGAQQEGLVLGKGGYVNVRDALNTRALKSLKVEFGELRVVVRDNDKQRFSMILASSLETEDQNGAEQARDILASPPIEKLESEAFQTIEEESEDPADYLIRANQGHSLKLDTAGLLTPITLAANNLPPAAIHGTTEPALALILKSGGLRRMGRNHIHFASGLPAGFKPLTSSAASPAEKEAQPVISGMRSSSTVLIYVDVGKALEAGIKFFVSENGVVLTEGDGEGCLSYAFFERVERRTRGGAVVMRDGVLPEGVVVDVEAWEREVGSGGGKKGRGGRGGGRGGRSGGKARVVDDSRDLMAGV